MERRHEGRARALYLYPPGKSARRMVPQPEVAAGSTGSMHVLRETSLARNGAAGITGGITNGSSLRYYGAAAPEFDKFSNVFITGDLNTV